MKSTTRFQMMYEGEAQDGTHPIVCYERFHCWPKLVSLPKRGDPWPHDNRLQFVDYDALRVWCWYKPWTWFCREWEIILKYREVDERRFYE